jgi:hypothetical protein
MISQDVGNLKSTWAATAFTIHWNSAVSLRNEKHELHRRVFAVESVPEILVEESL